MSSVIITKENFDKEVLQSEKPVLLVFSAEWCGHCHALLPVVEKLSEEMQDVKFASVDVDENMELAEKYNVMAVPALIVFKEGKVKTTASGVQTKSAIMSMLRI